MEKKSRLGLDPLKTAELSWIKDTRENSTPPGNLLSPIEYVKPEHLIFNSINSQYFETESQEYFDKLRQDIKERGIIVPLIAKRNGTLLAGENRLRVARDLGIALVPVQYLLDDLDGSREREFLIKDNVLRRQLSPAQKESLIRKLYPNELTQDNRGIKRKNDKSSDELLLTLPEKIEKETGIPAGTAKRLIARIRKEMRNETSPDDKKKENAVYFDAKQHLKSAWNIARKDKDRNSLEDFLNEVQSIQKRAQALLKKIPS